MLKILSGVVLAACLMSAQPVPRPAGPLEFYLPDGTKMNLDKFKGKVCVIEFLFTTCPHCAETTTILSRLNTSYASRGFQPIGIAFNDNAMMLVPEFVRNTRANYPVGVASRTTVLNFLKYSEMERLMVPQVAFIDRKGTIRFQSTASGQENLHSEARLRAHIEQLLNDPVPSAAPAKAAPKPGKSVSMAK